MRRPSKCYEYGVGPERRRDVLPPFILIIFYCFGFILPAFAQQLMVGKHAQSRLQGAEGRAIFDQASKALQTKDGPNDVPCKVTLLMAGDVSTFDYPTPTEIDTPDDFRTVCLSPGYVHVVNAINDCAGTTVPGIAGCSDTPGKCIVVVRIENLDSPDEEGLLWAHEYGHTKGLLHRSDENAIMNSYLGKTERQVDKVECLAFMGQANPNQNPSASNRNPDIIDFVHRRYVEGIPFDQASSYSRADAQRLVSLLDDPKQKPYLANIVVTLGMIGDPVVVVPLRTFIEKGDGEIDTQTLRAKTSALIALGYVVNKNKDQNAFNYLAQGLNPEVWNERKLKWKSNGSQKSDQRNISLVKGSALGLGISGSPEAEQVLSSASVALQSLDPSASAAVNPVIEHALDMNKIIRQEGLTKYQMNLQNR
jgi:hypothetical protein